MTVASPQQPVRSEQPEAAGPADRIGRRLGDLVLALLSVLLAQRRQKPVELPVVEAGQPEVEAVALQVAELEPQQRLVPLGVLARAVVHQPVGLCLRRRQPAGDMHRDGREAELARRLEPGVPGENHHRLVDDDRLAPAELLQRGRHRRHRRGVLPRVPGIGDQLLERQFDDVHCGIRDRVMGRHADEPAQPAA
jgi:hypothetical protein